MNEWFQSDHWLGASGAGFGAEESWSWRQCVTVFTEELSWLKGPDLDLVMGLALRNWVGWRLPGGVQRSLRAATMKP